MTTAKVSVLIPVRNQGRFLAEALDSVLAQAYTDFELYVADNASDDDTPLILGRYAAREPRLRWTRHDTNLGMVANWNHCLGQAQGEYVKFLCGDDKLNTPHALGKLVALLEESQSAVLAVSARVGIDEQSRQVRQWDNLRRTGLYPGRDIILRCLRETHNLVGEPSAALFRRKVAGRGFDPSFRQLMDMEMWFHLLEQGDLVYCAEMLSAFRLHSGQASILHAESHTGELEYARLMSNSLDKDWIRERIDRDLLFQQARWCRKRRTCDPEIATQAERLYEQLGPAWYGLCWVRHKLRPRRR